MTIRRAVLALAISLAVAREARADFIEIGDAGDTPATAQVTGSGALNFIRGSLSGYMDADMYAIYIPSIADFTATTDAQGTVAYDTQLFLFDSSGRPVCANDDIANGNGSYNPRSRLAGCNTWDSQGGGLYYLAVSGWDRDPVGPSGAEMFGDDANYSAVVGPSRSGRGSVMRGWNGDASGNGGTGAYTIQLGGAQVVPEPAALMLAMSAGLLLVRRRRAA